MDLLNSKVWVLTNIFHDIKIWKTKIHSACNKCSYIFRPMVCFPVNFCIEDIQLGRSILGLYFNKVCRLTDLMQAQQARGSQICPS